MEKTLLNTGRGRAMIPPTAVGKADFFSLRPECGIGIDPRLFKKE